MIAFKRASEHRPAFWGFIDICGVLGSSSHLPARDDDVAGRTGREKAILFGTEMYLYGPLGGHLQIFHFYTTMYFAHN